jgi:hypothetical protein
MEREGVGSVLGLLRIAKAFAVPLTTLTAGAEDHFKHLSPASRQALTNRCFVERVELNVLMDATSLK